MKVEEFWQRMKEEGITFWSGVPCSWLAGLITYAEQDKEITYVPAPREDVALGLVSGHYLGTGKAAGLMMQNSGLGNILGPLASFNMIYKVPAFIVMSLRNDAPEHEVTGKATTGVLDTLNTHYATFLFDEGLDYLLRVMMEVREPVVGLVLDEWK